MGVPNGWMPSVQQTRTWWANLPGARRWRLATAAGLGLATAIVLGQWATNPHWTPVYTHLSPSAAGAMTQVLQQQHLPYQLAAGGSTIAVPGGKVALARVTLAEHNLPAGGSTANMPISPKFTLGETSQEIQLTSQADLEQTLAATIQTLQGVQHARVLITEPPPSLFGESSAQPTASVFLGLAPGATLSPTQVNGIQHLVAGAVSGLLTKHVTVVNQAGALLPGTANTTPNATTAHAASTDLEATQAVDHALQQQVQNLLDPIYGPGNVVAQVQAQLAFSSSTQTQTQVAPKGTITSQETTKQSSSSAGVASKAAGVTGNTPTYPTIGATGPSKSSKSQTITHYAKSITKQTTTTPPGAIQRLTVAVAVNQTLTAAQQQQIQTLVSQAVGANAKRGDVVTVTGLAFSKQAAQQAQKAVAAAARQQRLREEILGGVGLLGVMLLVLLLRRRRKPAPQLDSGQPVHLTVEYPEEDEAETAEQVEAQRKLRESLVDWSQRDPDAVARVVRSMVEEG